MKNIILISMFFNFAFGQYDRCNTGVTGSIEGCDFSNGKNLEALNYFLGNTSSVSINDNNARNANFSGINFYEDMDDVNSFNLIDFSGSDFSGSVLAPINGNNNFSDANFSGAVHFGDDYGGNIYSNATFDGATLHGDFRNATMTNATFTSTNFVGYITIANSNMQGATFRDIRGDSGQLSIYYSFLENVTIEDSREMEISIIGHRDEPTNMHEAKLINANIVFPEFGIFDGIVSSDLVENDCCLKEPWVIEDGVLLNTLEGVENPADSTGMYSSFKGHDFYSVDSDGDGCISWAEFHIFLNSVR